jgi:hypothetical protein
VSLTQTQTNFGLRSIRLDARPLGDTITATLDWNQPAPAAPAAATAAGLPLTKGVQLQPLTPTYVPHTSLASPAEAGANLTGAPGAIEQLLVEIGTAGIDVAQRPAPPLPAIRSSRGNLSARA